MTLKTLLETILMNQYLSIYSCSFDKFIVDRKRHDTIPYTTISEFLEKDVVTVQAIDGDEEPYLYIEV